MFGSTSLEVAIGLVFVFLLLSLLVTAVTELVAGALNSRAKTLWRGIAALLEDASTQTAIGRSWTARLYAHPIMRPLFPLETQGNEEVLGPKGKGPSYIPPRSFAIALLDITGVTDPRVNMWQQRLQARLEALLPGAGQADLVRQTVQGVADEIAGALNGQQLKADLEEVAARLPERGSPDPALGTRLTQIAGSISGETLSFLVPLLQALGPQPEPAELRGVIRQIPTGGPESAAVRNGLLALLPRLTGDATALATAQVFAKGISDRSARQALSVLENNDLRGALLKLLDEAQGDVEKLKDHVEVWFNHSMDRVTGWYKRQTVVVHLIIATALAIFMNVDALVVVRHLAADPALRQTLLAQADSYVQKAAATPSPAATPAPQRSREQSPPLPMPPADQSPAPPADAAAAGTGIASTSTPAPKPAEETKTLEQAHHDYQEVKNQLLSLGLPIGWTLPAPAPGRGAVAAPPADEPAGAGGATDPEYRALPRWSLLLGQGGGAQWEKLGGILWFHSVGWLLSIFAATLGAPFWFDTLKMFVNIRATGRPPEPPPAGAPPPEAAA